jgi:hypothetical protein
VSVSKKEVLDTIDGTPDKRVFLSIISDYDIRTGLCELVDNAIDQWINNDRKSPLSVDIRLDVDRQMIVVADNAGGVEVKDARLLITPGATRLQPHDDQIGIFGVGGKRAAIALGEHVEIRTRCGRSKSMQIDLTPDWLATNDWQMTIFEIPDIEANSTSIEISKLRQGFSREDVYSIRVSLGETYARFLDNGCTMQLNEVDLDPISFDRWAYPPSHSPLRTKFRVEPTDKGAIDVTLTGGLILDRDGEAENYGVYFYCNDRLILKEHRTREVGYISGEAGVPHPDASLCRVIVELKGHADLMPWNSSKSGISFNHPAMLQIRSRLIDFVSYFSTVSRRLKGNWDNGVFAYKSGSIETVDPVDAGSNKKTVLPNPPRSRKLTRLEELQNRNRKLLADQPWTVGLVEAMGFIEVVQRQKLETRNRIALILLDSNLEIALKEFIVNRKDLFPPYKYKDVDILNLFQRRTDVIKAVTTHVPLPKPVIDKIDHYYGMRNKLIHERTTAIPTNRQIADYQDTVEKVLTALLGIRFPKP